MLGQRSPAWANAPGRALPARDPDLAAAVADRLGRHDDVMPGDPREFAAEVRHVRSNGYATTRNEPGAPVTGVVVVDDQAVAALGVTLGDGSSPAAEAPALVMRAAARLSSRLREASSSD